jgi:hypothetical protein
MSFDEEVGERSPYLLRVILHREAARARYSDESRPGHLSIKAPRVVDWLELVFFALQQQRRQAHLL